MAKGNRNKIVSASVLLATFPDVAPNSIWVEVDGQTAKMAAIKDGLPLPLADFFGAIQEADERIRQIEQDSGIQFVMYGNYRDVYASTIEISLDELVSEGSVADATLGQASRGVNKRLIVAGVSSLLTLAFMYLPGLYSDLTKPPPKPKEDPVKAYLKALPAKIQAAGVPVGAAIPAVRGDWTIETLQGGWHLREVTCTVTDCAYTWEVLGGNNISLQRAIGVQNIEFSLDGNTATYRLERAQPVGGALNAATFPPFQRFQATVGAFAQDARLVGVQFSKFTAPSLFGTDGVAISEAALKDKIRSGSVEITGPATFLDDTLARLPNSMTIESVKLTLNGIDPTFDLQGTYYVKN
jgi:hypothetical protein